MRSKKQAGLSIYSILRILQPTRYSKRTPHRPPHHLQAQPQPQPPRYFQKHRQKVKYGNQLSVPGPWRSEAQSSLIQSNRTITYGILLPAWIWIWIWISKILPFLVLSAEQHTISPRHPTACITQPLSYIHYTTYNLALSSWLPYIVLRIHYLHYLDLINGYGKAQATKIWTSAIRT